MDLKHLSAWLIVVTLLGGVSKAATDEGYVEIQGTWQAIELVDNGRVVPLDAIPGWLPSGGRLELVENTMTFTSSKDGKRHARVVSIDATTYPRQINVLENGSVTGHGIYRMDEGRLVLCLSSPSGKPRPTEFSAREGSGRMILVLARADSKPMPAPPTTTSSLATPSPVLSLPTPPVDPGVTSVNPAPLVDAEIGKLLPGTWKCTDKYGAFFLSLDKSGYYTTYRESVETSALQQVFRKLPVSSGTWKLNNGQVVLYCTSASDAARVYKSFPFTIRTVNPTDLEFIDYAGNFGKAVRTQP